VPVEKSKNLSFVNPLSEQTMLEQSNKIFSIIKSEKEFISHKLIEKIKEKDHEEEHDINDVHMKLSRLINKFIEQTGVKDVEYFNEIKTNLGCPSNRIETKMLIE